MIHHGVKETVPHGAKGIDPVLLMSPFALLRLCESLLPVAFGPRWGLRVSGGDSPLLSHRIIRFSVVALAMTRSWCMLARLPECGSSTLEARLRPGPLRLP